MIDFNEIKFNEFEQIILKTNNPVGSSVLLVLAFLAYSDSELDKSELNDLIQIAKASNHESEISKIISIAKNVDLYSLKLACEFIRSAFTNEKARLFLEMAIGIAIADGKLKHTENYFLRFLADLVGVGINNLKTYFFEITNRPFPEPADLSSHEFWANFEKNNKYQETPPTHRSKKEKYLYVLGLDVNASSSEIRKAFMRLAQIHHPDKFAPLGDEAVQAATLTFKRINEAYQYLVQNA